MLATFETGKVVIDIIKVEHHRGKQKTIHIREEGKLPAGFTPQPGAIIYLVGGDPGSWGPRILRQNGSPNSYNAEPVGGKTRGMKIRVKKVGGK
ncbi:MAG: hypothetical protein WDZ73_00570 [Candidatus Paceibacterota bacterium]